MSRTQASKRPRKKSNKKRRSWFSKRKPRGVTDAQALSAEKKITKHIPDAKNMNDVLVGIAEKEAWIENVERTLERLTQQETDRKQTEKDDRLRYHDLRISESSRENTSTTSKQGVTDAQANAHLKIF